MEGIVFKSISIVSSVPLTEPVIRNRLFPFFEAFTSRGVQVRCVCPKSEFDSSNLPEKVMLEEVDINFTKPNSFVKRAFKEASDVAALLKRAKKMDDERVLVTIPSMFFAFLAPIILRNKNVFMDVRDLSWEYLSEKSLIQRLAKRTFRFLFKRSVPFFKSITATNETEIEYIKEQKTGLTVHHVSNGIQLQQFLELSKIMPSENNDFTVSYIGNIGLAQHLDTLVETAKLLPDISFKIIGSGIDDERIASLISQYGLKNIEMTGRVSWDEVIACYNNTHVLYAQLTPDFSGAMPSKLYEYLSTGKQIVYGGQGQAVATLKQFDACITVPPCNAETLASAITNLQNEMDRQYLSQKNRQIIEARYIREKAVQEWVGKQF